MTKQRIVIKVHMTCDKCRRSALALAGSTYGVQSVGIEGEERDQLVVVGDGVDATSLTSCLRKTVKVGRADIIKVEEVVEEKKAAAAAATGCSNPVAACPPQWYPYHPGYGYYCPRTGVVYPYAAGGHCYVEDSDEGSWCAIM
ncbi:heavy metal-associated isoprenylated plant protein 47-like [Panicum hallii]|nr:heavy metal-associated isoprenylated plant protein 47-like [Panicum hallii]